MAWYHAVKHLSRVMCGHTVAALQARKGYMWPTCNRGYITYYSVGIPGTGS